MPGPIAAPVAPTASTPRATTPAASPRQPQCRIATPPGPARATGRQSATKTSAAAGRSAAGTRSAVGAGMTWPSTSGIAEPGSAKGLGLWTAVWVCSSAPWTCRPMATRSGAIPSAVASRRRFSATAPRSSPVRTPRLRRSKGASLTPPGRVEKAALAPGSSASSHRTASCSRHSTAELCLASGGEGGGELLLAAGYLAVELAALRLGQAAADGLALLDAGGDQVVSSDLEFDLAPLLEIVVQPVGAAGAGEHELDRVVGRRQSHGLGR